MCLKRLGDSMSSQGDNSSDDNDENNHNGSPPVVRIAKDSDGVGGKLSRMSNSGKVQKVMHKQKKTISSKVRSKHK